MIERFLNAFWPQLIILFAVYALVMIMIVLDLWSGVRKARQRKEYCSSDGYKRTVKKIATYYNALFCITVIDTVQMLVVWLLNEQAGHRLPVLPLLTFAGAMFIGFIELKSICEKAEQKDRARAAEAAAMLGKALKDRDTQDILTAVIDYMKTEKTPQRREEPTVRYTDRRYMPDPDVYNEPENEE